MEEQVRAILREVTDKELRVFTKVGDMTVVTTIFLGDELIREEETDTRIDLSKFENK